MGVAIVTGAARGIGAATARALSADGHQLVLIDRCRDDPRLDYSLGTESELRSLADELNAHLVIGDVSLADTSTEAVVTATEQFGGVDIAVAAAGAMAETVTAWAPDDIAWAAMLDTNLTGTLQLARSAIPVMLEREAPRHGRFVALSSAISHKAAPRLAAYAASKAAVEGFVRSLAADLGNSGITANAVQPGSTDTALLNHSATIYDLDSPSEFAQHHLNQRLLEPIEIAAAIAWLCSPAAAAITGSVIPVDGGMTAK